MAFSVQTNVNALAAQENLRATNNFQTRTIQRLTSGFRINNAGDDAAGLSIANKFRSDISELSTGIRNSNDGLSTLQIIDGGLNNISQMLDRMGTLASQSASGTFTGDRAALTTEFQTLAQEVDRQASGIGLAGGGSEGGRHAKSLSVYVGGHVAANANVTVDLSQSTVDAQSLGLASTTDGEKTLADISTAENAAEVLQTLKQAVTTLGNAQAAVGRGQNQLSYAVGLAQSQLTNFAAAESRIRDADIASEAANLTKGQVLVQAGMAAMAQANSAPQAVLALLRG